VFALLLLSGGCDSSSTLPLLYDGGGASGGDAPVGGDARDPIDAWIDVDIGPPVHPDGGTVTDSGQLEMPVRCNVPTDCPGAAPTIQFCAGSGWSCIDFQCLAECGPGGRSCMSPQRPGCLFCGTTVACPAAQACLPGAVVTASVEAASCPTFPGTTEPFAGAQVTLTRSSPTECDYTAHEVRGVDPLGRFYQLDDGSWTAFIEGFGGTCTGVMAPTNALRIIFSCPACRFVLGW
jgi:hypothetical protein